MRRAILAALVLPLASGLVGATEVYEGSFGSHGQPAGKGNSTLLQKKSLTISYDLASDGALGGALHRNMKWSICENLRIRGAVEGDILRFETTSVPSACTSIQFEGMREADGWVGHARIGNKKRRMTLRPQ